MVQVLRRFAGMEVDIQTVRPFMQKGFPWNNPDCVNPPRRSAEDWWDALLPVFEQAFAGCHLPSDQARALAREVRAAYTDIAEWKLFGETTDVLTALREEGWKHVILSNHVPELPSLVHGLGLTPLIHRIVNSAETGFEKPHPRAFETALSALEHPADIWMVGDNMTADVLGAEAAGLRAILVRTEDSRAAHRAENLRGVRNFLG